MSLRILVTGATGFTGRHLTALLGGNRSHELVCSVEPEKRPPETSGVIREAAPIKGAVPCDLRDAGAVCALIEEARPDQIYHLAGSFSQDYEADYAANVLSTRNILEAVLHCNLETRTLLIGSAAEYGAIKPEDNPVKETQPLNPASVYGLTKAFQTQLMNFYCAAYSMNIVMARVFNLLGRGISASLFVGQVYEQIRAFRGGERDIIELGNLDCFRDYLRVETAVADYVQIMNHGNRGAVYHVASGKPVQMRELLAQILNEEAVPPGRVREDSGRNPGKFNVPSIYADISKLEALRREV